MPQSKSRIHAEVPVHDLFDRMPGSILLVIFNKITDVRSLGRCFAVSKRFNALVPFVHDVYVKIDRVITINGEEAAAAADDDSRKPRNLFNRVLKLMLFAFLKPFGRVRNGNGRHNALVLQVSHHSPAWVLKNFTHVKNLRIDLPAGDVGTEDGVVLKWRAEFGSTLQSCVILGGTKVGHKPLNPADGVEDNAGIPDSFYTNGGLKLRVVWTISALIAASTRHHLLRPIIEDHPTIESLILTDGQGTLSMGAEQLREFRENCPVAISAASDRTQVPASNMKLRYAPFLELAEGVGMQGGNTGGNQTVGGKQQERGRDICFRCI